jgi:hypothetical protein
MPAHRVDSNGIARLELPFENLLRERILELLLDRAF